MVSGIITTKFWICCEVGVGPAHQLTGLGRVVEGEVQPLEVGEDPLPQVGLDPVGDAEGLVAAQTGVTRLDQADADQTQRPVQ